MSGYRDLGCRQNPGRACQRPSSPNSGGMTSGRGPNPPCFSFPHCEMKIITAPTRVWVDHSLRSIQESAQCQLGTEEWLAHYPGAGIKKKWDYLRVWKSLTQPKTSSLSISHSEIKLIPFPHNSQNMTIPLLWLGIGSHLLTEQTFTEQLLCARHYSKH